MGVNRIRWDGMVLCSVGRERDLAMPANGAAFRPGPATYIHSTSTTAALSCRHGPAAAGAE